MAQVKFYRGKKEDYDNTTHLDGVYFAVDTEEVVMNGKEYGKDPDWNEIDSVLGNPLTKVWFVDGTTQEIDLNSIYGYINDDEGIFLPTTQFEQSAENITKIEIGTNVTSIGESAFNGCSGLTSIEIPNSVTSIGANAFSNCSGLESIEIPNSVTNIGNSAFGDCESLTSVTIPNSVTSIGIDAFGGCSGLESIEIPNSVTSIGDWAFSGCSGLESINIPDSVTSIGKRAFSCESLTSVTYNGTEYTSKSALTSALTTNGVTLGDDVFEDTSLSA